MTNVAWFLLGLVVYLVIGVVLKNHTKIGTVKFKNFSTRFIVFYIFPLAGLVVYVVGMTVYTFMMAVAELVFDSDSAGPGGLFPEPPGPKYPCE